MAGRDQKSYGLLKILAAASVAVGVSGVPGKAAAGQSSGPDNAVACLDKLERSYVEGQLHPTLDSIVETKGFACSATVTGLHDEATVVDVVISTGETARKHGSVAGSERIISVTPGVPNSGTTIHVVSGDKNLVMDLKSGEIENASRLDAEGHPLPVSKDNLNEQERTRLNNLEEVARAVAAKAMKMNIPKFGS